MQKINAELAAGRSVVADATNFGTWMDELELIAFVNKAVLEVEFMDTPIQECIRRDYERPPEERVGAAAIRMMYNKYLREE